MQALLRPPPTRNHSRPLLSFLKRCLRSEVPGAASVPGVISLAYTDVCASVFPNHPAPTTAQQPPPIACSFFLHTSFEFAVAVRHPANHAPATGAIRHHPPVQHCTTARGCVFRLFTCPINVIITSTCSFTFTSQLAATAVGARRPNETQRGVGLPAAGLLCCNSQRRSHCGST